MEMGPFDVDVKAGPDRFSTIDEIWAALSFLPDLFAEGTNDRSWEVASDLGGYVIIDTEDAEVLALLKKLDAAAN
jgi:hypothetical protein